MRIGGHLRISREAGTAQCHVARIDPRDALDRHGIDLLAHRDRRGGVTGERFTRVDQARPVCVRGVAMQPLGPCSPRPRLPEWEDPLASSTTTTVLPREPLPFRDGEPSSSHQISSTVREQRPRITRIFAPQRFGGGGRVPHEESTRTRHVTQRDACSTVGRAGQSRAAPAGATRCPEPRCWPRCYSVARQSAATPPGAGLR